ncbi:MAG TPA: peptidoglycan recognition protein [Streptosporangiaceae bacterium]|nr:peptidoglycan recognition protein [Streptosporangiaceae bacterium]
MQQRVRAPYIAGLCTVAAATVAATVYVLGSAPSPASGGAVEGTVHSIALRDMAAAGAADAADRRVSGLPAVTTAPFSLIGVTWDDASADLIADVRVRARGARTGAWSGWLALEPNEADAPDPRSRERSASRGSSAPLWVGPSNGVEVRVAGRGAPPRGLRVELVDPDGDRRTPHRAAGAVELTPVAAVETADPPSDSPAEPSQPAATTTTEPSGPAEPPPATSPAASPAATAQATATDSATSSATTSSRRALTSGDSSSTAPRPSINGRASWGADESLVTDLPEYGQTVKAVFVHHTAGTNSYACADSPSIIRSIFLFHVRSNGWNDIGYNFLVDKCGTIFEGRGGGVDRPVLGAHTYGFNTDTTGVSVLGTYTSTAPGQPALDSVAKIAAWKLGLHGGDPAGTTTLTERATDGKYPYGTDVTFHTIAGHRDGFATECPGDLLYGKLGAIRTAAKAWTTPLTSLTPTGLGGTTKVGSTYYTKGSVTFTWRPAAVSGYEVLVDGATAARVDGSATSAKVTLTAGPHTLRLRAANINGTIVDSPDYPVVADPAAPVFTKAATLAIRSGTVSTSVTTPVALSWKVTDGVLLHSVKATSPAAATFAPTTTSWSKSAKLNTATTWSLTAADAAGNTATSAATRTVGGIAESGSVRAGTWKPTAASTSYIGGKAVYSGAKGASAAYTFTGRSAGLIVKRAANHGVMDVYVDGVKAATVDTYAATTSYRQIVWTKTWSTAAKHTVKLVVLGTAGRPYVVTDGIVFVK